MKIPVRQSERGVDFNVTPLIDIVFLLVIFFLVTSQMVQHDTVQEISLPQTVQAEEEQHTEPGRLVITIDQEGLYYLAGRQVTQKELENMLPEESTITSIRIRSDKSTPYQFVEPLLYQFSKRGISDVSFAVDREPHSEN